MTKEEIIRNLEYTMEKHKNDIVNTFDTNISVMCKDILDYLKQEPCNDAISRQAVMDEIEFTSFDDYSDYLRIREKIEALPSVKQEPCEDAVSRQWLMRKATERFYITNYFNHITKMIEEAPPVTPRQKAGHWKDCGEREPWYRCSKCGEKTWGSCYKYCPHCGARMIKLQESEE